MQNLLPIDSLKLDFLKAIQTSHLVIEAETGSGKSTRLPLWAAEFGRVLVVEPRRVACTALAEYVASSNGETLGKRIGYAIRFDNRFDDNTQVVFVTPGVALRWMIEDKLQSFTTIMVDEFHERRWDTDLLLALLKKENAHQLIATSATMDSQRLADYLGAQHLKAAGRTYNVEVVYKANDSRDMPDVRGIERKVKEVVEQYYREQDDILIFLPGRKEISQCVSTLTQHFKDQINLGLIDVIPLHASVSDDERHRALTKSDKQRIIVATNVAETSLTIPGVTLIIDSGLERRTHQRNGRTVLGLHAISNASSEQRKGRAGRVSEGICVRLYGKAAPLEYLTPPELHREELVEPMLAAACCGYQFNELAFVDSLPEKTTQQAIVRLHNMRAIDQNGRVTAHGRLLFPLPIDTLFAHLITVMPNKASQEAMVDLSAALSVPQRLWLFPKSEEGREELVQWQPLHCDATTLIKILREDAPESLNVDKQVLQDARQLSSQIRDALELPMLEVATSIKREQWLNAVIEAAPELVFVRREKRKQALGNGYSEVSIGRESRFSDDDEAAIVFDQYAMPGRGSKQTLALATCMTPISLEQLIALDLGEQVAGKSEIVEGECRVEIERRYAGRVIQRQWQKPKGSVAKETLVDLILQGYMLSGLAEKISADIQQWNLYLALGRYDASLYSTNIKSEPVDVVKWLSIQIEDLGIESSDDLELFSMDDFHFEGIPVWEREDFDTEYPHRVQLNDLVMNIEYGIHRKTVVATYVKGNRKTDPKRWELPRWQGWKIQYRKASRMIDIK